MTDKSPLLWGSYVSREALLQQTNLLAILGSSDDSPRTYDLVETRRRTLSVHQEAEIAGNMAFLSRRSLESHNVAAIGLEEADNGHGMIVRVAVNGKMLSSVVEGLGCICETLESIAKNGATPSDNTELLLTEVVRLTFPRFRSRLKLGRRNTIESSPIMNVEKLCCDINLEDHVKQNLCEMVSLNRQMKALPSQPPTQAGYRMAVDIMKLAAELTASGLLDVLDRRATAQNNVARQTDSVRKIGQYYRATRQLVFAAHRHGKGMFRRIQVCPFKIQVPCSVRNDSRPGSCTATIQTARAAAGGQSLLHRFRHSAAALDGAIVARLNKTRSAIKVHAEMQLLFFYECNRVSNPPRLIAVSKSSCYLCDLFLRLHGSFQVISTFGGLNERWILPDWISIIDQRRIDHLRTVVEEFDRVLNLKFRTAVEDRKRRPDPIESLVALSAAWRESSMSVATVQGRCIASTPMSVAEGTIRTAHVGCSDSRLSCYSPMDLSTISLPFSLSIHSKNRQVWVTVGSLSLAFEFSRMAAGHLFIDQENIGDCDFDAYDVMAIPLDAELKVQCRAGTYETCFRIRHGSTVVRCWYQSEHNDSPPSAQDTL